MGSEKAGMKMPRRFCAIFGEENVLYFQAAVLRLRQGLPNEWAAAWVAE
jgi:hypothetical protein